MGRRARGSQVTVKGRGAYHHRRRDAARLRLHELDHYSPPGSPSVIGLKECFTFTITWCFADCDHVNYLSGTYDVAASAWSGNVLDADPVLENVFIEFANGDHASTTAATGTGVRLTGTTGILEVPENGVWIESGTLPPEDDPYQRNQSQIDVLRIQSGSQRAFAELAEAVRYGGNTSIGGRELEPASNLLLGPCVFVLEGRPPHWPDRRAGRVRSHRQVWVDLCLS
jgi:hypothetical protein